MSNEKHNKGDAPEGELDKGNPRREMTTEEAAAVLVLVRGGWLKLELTL